MPRRTAVVAVAALVAGIASGSTSPFESSITFPVTLKYRVTIEDVRTNASKAAQEEFENARLDQGVKSGRIDYAQAQKSLAAARSRIAITHERRVYLVTLATDGSNVLLLQDGGTKRDGNQQKVFLFTEGMTVEKYVQGDSFTRKGVDTRVARTMPYVCASFGVMRQFIKRKLDDAENPDREPYALALPAGEDTPNKSDQLPSIAIHLQPGKSLSGGPSDSFVLGLKKWPMSSVQVGATKEINGASVLSDYTETSSIGAAEKAQPIERTTVKLEKVAEPLPASAFKVEAYLKKGSLAQVAGAPSFYYDPAAGSLTEQAGKRIKIQKLHDSDVKASQQGQSGIVAVVIGLVTVCAAFMFVRFKRGRGGS